ncbi:MAG: hypothetical protein FGM24_00200 [Candidatus Kapabacteria bacterium]|nr:hypothetical protein [Candidatus Kapabacteria bacterium]
MRLLWFFAATIAVAIVTSCAPGTGGDIKVDFGEVVDRQQNLVFTFPQKMMADSLVSSEWVDTAYVKFTPAVRGRFQWRSSTELIFSPATGFSAATAYTAEVTESLLGQAGKDVRLPSTRTFDFHTEWLTLDETVAQWSANDVTGEPEVTVTLTFNYDIDPLVVAKHLRITHNGSMLPTRIRSEVPSSTLIVSIDGKRIDADGAKLSVTIGKGLRCVESETPTKDELTTALEVPSRRLLEVVRMESTWEGSDGIINVVTTQAIDASTLTSDNVAVSPEVDVSLETTSTGFRIRGLFTVGETYSVTISTAVLGVVGGKLDEAYEGDVEIAEMMPEISFVSERAVYLGARGSRAIGVRIVNVPEVRISVFLVYENNIGHALRAARDTYWADEDDDVARVGYDADYISLDEYADTVFSRVYQTAELGRAQHGVVTYELDVKQHARRKGMYVVKVEGTDDAWQNASTLVAMSDVGLIAKQGLNDLSVFAHSIYDTSPLGSVELTLYSTNHQVIDRITTNAAGVAAISNLRERLGRFKLGMITARRGEDFTFMHLEDTRVDAARFATGGLHENVAELQAFVYGDRELYRPGETVHLNTIVRTKEWGLPRNIPVTLVMRGPDGQEVRRMRLAPDAEGSAAVDIPMSSSSMTGMYRVEILSATDILLTSHSLAIEDFLPDKLKVDLGASSATLAPATPFDVYISAASFTGIAAADRSYEMTVRIGPAEFAPRRYPAYDFAVSTGDINVVRTIERSGKLDRDGKATARCEIGPELADMGLLQAQIFVTVFDETGRPVHRLLQREVRTQPVMFGIKRMERYVGTRQQLQIPVIACTHDGSLASGRARVRVLRHEWHSAIEDNGGYSRFVTQKRTVVISDRMVDVRGEDTRVSVTPTVSGEYEVQIGMVKGGTVSRTFYAFGYGDTQASSFPVNTEGLVDITLDKPSYKPGETAKVLFTTPFAGTLIVAVERDGMLEHHTIRTDKRSASLALRVRDNWTPNVYIAATLIKAHVADGMPLTVAHGYQPLTVVRPSSRLNVSINAPLTSRSRRTQTIAVQTVPGARVTIAVVDEGIMQVRNTATPDPHGYFYQKRALQVSSHDMYPMLFPEYRIRKQAYGAGDDEMSRRLNPFTVDRDDLVTYWSGVINAPSGRASVNVDLPAFAGAVRIMAVAYKGSAFGSASQLMTVKDPLVVSTALPRVMAPGDTAQASVILTNTTPSAMQATCMLAANGALRVIGKPASVTIAPNRDAVATFTVVGVGLGPGTVTTTATASGETFTSKTSLAVRPVSPLSESSGSGSVAAGATANVTVAGNYVAGTGRGRLLVSTFPAVQITRNLSKLLEYPYGCVEQTVSKAFPQIYFADLVKAWQGTSVNTANPLQNVQEAVRAVERMQSYNGGVTYWPGGGTVTWWGTAYAAHFLHEARRAGHEVNNDVLQRMLSYLAERVRHREMETVRRYDPDGMQEVQQPARETFYSLFVLAAAGRQDVPTMNYWTSSVTSLSQDSRYMLACTYLMLGDRKTYRQILPTQFREERYRPLDGGSFASPIRDMALSLYALVEAAPDDPQTASLARRLSSLLQNESTLSTQENAFAVLALGRLARRAASNPATATITRNGTAIATLAGGTTKVDAQPGSSYGITAKGGTVYYLWTADGVRADGRTPIEDRVLQVRRTLLDRTGKVLTGSTFSPQQLIVIKVTIRTLDNSTVDNVVISDVLPAGFELENPRLGADGEVAFAKDGTTASYYDYRADRINLFVKAEGRARHYYYMVRAVSKGRFRMGPIGADAMYDDDVHSYHGGGVIAVK